MKAYIVQLPIKAAKCGAVMSCHYPPHLPPPFPLGRTHPWEYLIASFITLDPLRWGILTLVPSIQVRCSRQTITTSVLVLLNKVSIGTERGWLKKRWRRWSEDKDRMRRRRWGESCEEEAHSHVLTLMGQYLIIWNGVAVSCSWRCSSLLEHLQGRQVIKL